MGITSAVPDDIDSGYEIDAVGLQKSYVTPGGVTVRALDGVDLHIDPAEVVALVGPSGSGKSTLLHLLGGMDEPDAGSISCDGRNVTALRRSELVAFRRTVGFVFQHFALLPALTARDNVMLPVLPYKTSYDAKQRARSLLHDVGLAGREDALPSQLSGGQRQRVALARSLMNDPRLLVADEPTGNLDSATGADILNLLFAIREARGVTVVLATHDTTVAARCDRVLQIADGRLVM